MGLFQRVKIALIIFIAVVISGTFGFWALEPEVNTQTIMFQTRMHHTMFQHALSMGGMMMGHGMMGQ